ncbi:DoxX family protein [Xenorhabdus bovienii]|uniref:DoxX family protein n=1 Tax=Xenorhabdus bovienii TaxID=40576 RepID=UPI001EDDD756|nr:DoxX family protein [Xenorhabdus bovienii]MCG3462875.1 DoxX family protein [Xenorhabdus bovienii]
MLNGTQLRYAALIARYSLAIAYLVAVADRLGLCGEYGDPQITWGNFTVFLGVVKHLNPWAPDFMIPIFGWGVTILEVALPIFLIIGFKIKETALVSAALLLIFAVTMTTTGLLKSVFDYSVLSAFSCSLLLYCFEKFRMNEDKKQLN